MLFRFRPPRIDTPTTVAARTTVEALEGRVLLSVSLVDDIIPGPTSSFPNTVVVAGNEMFFCANDKDSTIAYPSFGLFKTDGTTAGTVEVHKLGVVPTGPIVNDNGTIYFDAEGPSFHAALWKSDGTQAGTVLIDNSPASWLTVIGTTLYFGKNNAVWKTDPTTDATSPAVSGLGTLSALAEYDGKLLISADQLYLYDGSTPSVVGPPPGRNFAVLEGTLYFAAPISANQWVLYRSDGTAAGTSPVATLPQFVNSLVEAGGRLLFNANNQLYASDGTAAGTKVISPDHQLLFDRQAFAATLGGEAFYLAVNVPGTGDLQLWETDGTAAGTRLVHDAVEEAGSNPPLVTYNGLLYFSASQAPDGTDQRLWQTDGTTAGTKPVDGIRYHVSALSNTTSLLTTFKNQLYFSPPDPTVGNELFALDTSQALAPLVIRGTDGDDTITVSLGPADALVATVNGATTSYTPAQYAGGITIDSGKAGGAGDTLNIAGLPVVPTTVNGQGLLTVTVGSASRGTQDVLSLPLVIGGAGDAPVKLKIEDSADPSPRTAVIDPVVINGVSYDSLIGLAPGEIRFADGRVASPLIVNAGDGGNDLTLDHIPPTVMDLNTGNGADTVNVSATPTGSILNINGQNGADTVLIGDQSMDGVQSIRGVVNVSNPLGKTALTVNDFGDFGNNAARTATFDTFTAGGQIYGTLQGLAPGAINFDAAQMASVFVLGYTTALTIKNTPGGAPLTFDTAEADILATAPGQVLNLSNDLAGGPQAVTVDFSANKIGAGTRILAATSLLRIIGSGAADHFTVGGGIVHGSVTVGFDSDSLGVLKLTHGTFGVTGDLFLRSEVDIEGADTTANILTTQHQTSFGVSDGGTMVLANGADLHTQGLFPAVDGKVDLGTSRWFMSTFADPNPSAQLEQLIREGLGGTAGILSSATDATHGVGFVVSQGGATVGYALDGDANMDGTVDFTDLLALAQNYGRTNAYWYQGDFNYDGKVDFSDLLKAGQNYGRLLAPSAAAAAAGDPVTSPAYSQLRRSFVP